MRKIVVSGINLFRGGTLRVMQDCIAALSAFAGNRYEIIALVHNEKQFPSYSNVRYISYPLSRKSYLFRLYCEYVGFKKLSRQLNPYCWFSLHDTTPNVIAEKRMVYCHNPYPFFKPGIKGFYLQRNIFFLCMLSEYLYKINIKKNDYVVVQQEWLRQAFKKMFSIDNIVVALPVSGQKEIIRPENQTGKKKKVFFYPAAAILQKNFEVICRAACILEKEGVDGFEVIMTLKQTENKYANYICKTYRSLKTLRFVGFLPPNDVAGYYENSDCLLFPSKAETWGLPVSEAKAYGKPLLLSDLPYAKETAGKYDKVCFFDPDNAEQLAALMKNFINGTIVYDTTGDTRYEQPVVRNWDELVRFLFPHLPPTPSEGKGAGGRLKQAVLITAYKNVEQVIQIIDYFDKRFEFYIHFDKRSALDLSLLRRITEKKVFVCNTFPVYWGGVNHLKAILLLAEEALRNRENTFFHLITGEDFPCKPPAYFFENVDYTKDYMDVFPLPYPLWPGNGGMDRLDYCNFYDVFDAKKSDKPIHAFIRLQKLFKIKRTYPAGFPRLYGGSTYWSLSRKTLQYALDYTNSHPAFLDRMKHTFASEEIYFQTIIMNSPFASHVVNDNLRYIDWQSGRGGRPAFLDESDFPRIASSDKLFARKFDTGEKSEALKKLLIGNVRHGFVHRVH
jgi:glycosyltransferase involved in cell wall biosynthesis